jgi:hypothetical protein
VTNREPEASEPLLFRLSRYYSLICCKVPKKQYICSERHRCCSSPYLLIYFIMQVDTTISHFKMRTYVVYIAANKVCKIWNV